MLVNSLHAFSGQKVLLLQGPVGPFFARLAKDLEQVEATVYKVNFNAGDWLFYPRNAIAFNQPMHQWPAFFMKLLDTLQVHVVLLFGDCRPIHASAREIAKARGISVGVFEEGYLRPSHITLERHGVNGHSAMPRSPLHYLNQPDLPAPRTQPLPKTYWHMVGWCFVYFVFGSLGKPWFPHYQHHRRLNLLEGLPWLRSVWRKYKYQWKQRGAQAELAQLWDGRYFLVPLQVFNDSQLSTHSAYASIDEFIEETMTSFAHHAPADTALVIKHHPMDRGYVDHMRSIAAHVAKLGLHGRCYYLHDQHLPTLLDHARGVVVVNSTVGLQALIHGVPVKPMGHAIYNMQGLCYQAGLDTFWQEAHNAKPHKRLLQQFVNYLKGTSQVNGSFYRAMNDTPWHTGVAWFTEPSERPRVDPQTTPSRADAEMLPPSERLQRSAGK